MFINNQYIFILISYIFQFQIIQPLFYAYIFFSMDIYEKEQAKKIDAKIKAWTYFYKDFVSGDAKCKICYTVIKTYNQATGLLQLHLEQVHGIDFEKIFTKDDQVKSLNPQLLPSLGTLGPQKQQNSLNFLNLPNGQHDWLSPFIEQVSQQESEPVDQDRDQYKFFVHSTQYTDPLKYTQFNRYSEQQLAQIRQQMNQLANFNKTPAMVTLAQKQLYQSNMRVKQRPQQIIPQIIVKIKQNFHVYQWRNIQQKNQVEGQENVQQKCTKSSPSEMVQCLLKKDYEVIQLRKLHKQNDKQNQVLFQENNPENKEIQCLDNSQNVKDCSSFIIINQKMKHYYSRYADSVGIVAFEAQKYIILLMFVQDWRQNYENVGIIILQNLQAEKLKVCQQIQANFTMFFHSISSKLPKGIFFISFLEQNQRNESISSHIKDAFEELNQKISSSGQNLIYFAEIKCRQDAFQEKKKKKKRNIQQIERLYEKLQQKIAQKIAKYSEQFGELRSMELPVIFSQLAIHSIQDKKRNHQKTKQDSPKKQLAIHMKINDYINPQSTTTTRSLYQGFITQKKRITSIRNLVKIFLQTINYQQSNLGLILDTLFNFISCNRYYQIGIQVEKGLAQRTFPKLIKQLQQRLSPNILEILHEIYRQSQSITHLTYRTSTLIEVYSVIFQRQDETILEKEKIENVLQNPAKLKAFKNTVLYHDNIRAWVCNCHRINLYGLPCYHIMKVVEKMKGSIYYYINQRWKPDQKDLLLFKADYDQWRMKSSTGQPQKNDK